MHYPDSPTITWTMEELGRAIFYHIRELNERFMTYPRCQHISSISEQIMAKNSLSTFGKRTPIVSVLPVANERAW